MTVATANNRMSYACDGSTVIFPYTFKIFQDSDLVVKLRDTNGVETLLVLTTDYTVSGAGAATGGNVTTVSTYASGNQLIILRQIPLTQLTDYVENDAFLAETHEGAIDRAIMLSQQLDEAVGRAIKMPESSPLAGAALEITEGVLANKILGFDAAGTAIELKSTAAVTNPDFYTIGDYNDDLAQAITDIGASNVTLLINKQVNVTADATVPSNIYLWFLKEGSFNISAAKTVTVASPEHIIAGTRSRIVSGSGTLAFTQGGNVYPEWWGENTTPGTTDMTAEINAALTSITTIGGTCWISIATYLISTILNIGSNTTLEGYGWASIIKADTDFGDNPLVRNLTHAPAADVNRDENITVKNLQLDGNKANNSTGTDSSHCLMFYSVVNLLASNNYCKNPKGDGIYVGGTSDAFDVVRGDVSKIFNNKIEGAVRQGIAVVDGININIESNFIKDGTLHGIDLEPGSSGIILTDVVISNNIIKSNGSTTNTAGIAVNDGSASTSERVIVKDNIIENQTGQGINFRGFDGLTIKHNIIKGCSYRGIMEASGGADVADNVIISGNVILAAGDAGIITSSNGLVIINNLVDTNATGAAIQSDGNDCIVMNNMARNSAGSGILENTVTTNSLVKDNFAGLVAGNNVGLDTIRGRLRALANSATPAVDTPELHSTWLTGGTTTITDFNTRFLGQIITIVAEHTITITDGTNIFLNGSANFDMTATDTLTLIQKADQKWYEMSRGDNGA